MFSVITLERTGAARFLGEGVETILLDLNRFNVHFGGWDEFLELHGVGAIRLGLGEVVRDEVEDVRHH